MNPSTEDSEIITGIVVRGHGVASGRSGDPRFPGGTIRMQLPFFHDLGLDLRDYFPATINLSLGSRLYRIVHPDHTFRNVCWHPTEPAEDFSFVRCRIRPHETNAWMDAWIYFPHPETKPEHFQAIDTIEIIARESIAGVEIGSRIDMSVSSESVEFGPSAEPDHDAIAG